MTERNAALGAANGVLVPPNGVVFWAVVVVEDADVGKSGGFGCSIRLVIRTSSSI